MSTVGKKTTDAFIAHIVAVAWLTREIFGLIDLMTIHSDKYASLVAPMVVPIAVFLVLVFSGNSVYSSLFTAVLYGLISYLGFFVFILPIDQYLKNRKLRNLALLVSGVAGGALIVGLLLYLLAMVLGSRERFDIQATAIGSFLGGTVAIVYCLLTRNSKHWK